MMSLTCKSITGEGRGFSGASGTGGGRGIGVHKTTNSKEMWEGSASLERGRGERGTRPRLEAEEPLGPEAEEPPRPFLAWGKASGSWGLEWKGEAEREEEDRMDRACAKGHVINQTSSQGRKRTQTHRALARHHSEP